MNQTQIIEILREMAEPEYKAFHSRLVPTVPSVAILGVKIPKLRLLARQLDKNGELESVRQPPFEFVEQKTLCGISLGYLGSFDEAIEAIDRFLPHIDNWATCDTAASGLRIFKKNPAQALPHIERWLASDEEYTVRFGVVVALAYYLDNNFSPHINHIVGRVCGDKFYINMAVAWYFSVALVKQYDATLPYFTARRLPRWVHNKALQKARESRRVDSEKKALLQNLKY